MLQQAFGLVRLRLGNVDMKARIEVGGHAAAGFKRFIAHGERRMQAEKPAKQIVAGALATLKKGAILLDALLCNFRALTIRNFVAEATAQSGKARSLCDAKQATGNSAGAGMVIEDGGGAVADAVDHGHRCAQIHIVKSEHLVEPPPQALQDLGEVAGSRVFQRHSAGKRAVKMHVRVDEAGHDEPAAGIDETGTLVTARERGGRSGLGNQTIADCDGAVFNQRLRRVVRDETAVADEKDCGLLHGAMDSSQPRRPSVVIQITIGLAPIARQSMHKASAGCFSTTPVERPSRGKTQPPLPGRDSTLMAGRRGHPRRSEPRLNGMRDGKSTSQRVRTGVQESDSACRRSPFERWSHAAGRSQGRRRRAGYQDDFS